jgi:hypothetical protein
VLFVKLRAARPLADTASRQEAVLLK